jgi:hypothetical protein
MKGLSMLHANMKTFGLSLLILLSSHGACFAVDDAKILAVGDWSAPVTGTAEATTGRGAHRPVLCGRLLFSESPKNHSPAVYLELQDCGEVWGMTEVYCDMGPNGGCRLESRDASGKPIEWEPGPFSGWAQGSHWITLPCDSTIRLRVSRIATFIYASKGDYLVSGTFSSRPPKDPNDHRLDVWQGTLKLPAVKIIPKKQP